jgi:hypothetical protein
VQGKRVLFVGLGDLGSQVFDEFVRVPGNHRFLVCGRNLDYLRLRTNVSIFTAMQLGLYPDVTCVFMDVRDVDQTAETISRFEPDIIFCAVTMQPWLHITRLPKPNFERLYQAQVGPWLPLTLAPVYKLMQAMQQTALVVKVINASFPDVIHPVLRRAGLSPTTGIGNLANNIPALRKSIALKLHEPVEQVKVRFFAEHYVSHKISRVGNAGGAPFHLTALVDGKDVTHLLDMETVFELLPTTFKRSVIGARQLLTSASATVVFEGLANDTNIITHVPGPNGLPGGYPVRVNAQGVEVVLPESLTFEQSIRLNEDGMNFDGIERIDDDGTVYFAEQNMAILKETLGYECRRMPLSEVEEWANELQAKYRAFASAWG